MTLSLTVNETLKWFSSLGVCFFVLFFVVVVFLMQEP